MQNNTFSPLIVGQKIVSLARVDSTNSYLRIELANSAPLPEGTVILAEDQYAGRGQLNNNWHSQTGKNLTFSVLLHPWFLTPYNQFKLNIAISLAINDTLKNIVGISSKIKWPNDIYYNDSKIGGVLIENILGGDNWKHAIVGIGINVNQTDFPPELQNVSSIKEILHQDYDKEYLLQQLCKAIEFRYLQLKEGRKQEAEYIGNMYRYNEVHQFWIRGLKQEGKIIGMDPIGRLAVKVKDTIHLVNMKEVSFVIT